jgi:hypothetical protein
VNWYSSFYNPDSAGVVRLTPDATVAGGHEFVLDEIDMERKLIGATNSWGSSWGKNGRFYIPFDVMKRLLSEKGDVTVFMPITSPAPKPEPVVPTPLVVDPVTPDTPVAADPDDLALWNRTKAWARVSNTSNARAVKAWAATKGLT